MELGREVKPRLVAMERARYRAGTGTRARCERVTLVGVDVAADGPAEIDVLALHESLERLAVIDPQQERIVELRYFGGLTIQEAAEAVGTSEATIVREWTVAKAWLRADLSRGSF